MHGRDPCTTSPLRRVAFPAGMAGGEHGEHVPWWHDAVVYQIYPRSFPDTQRRWRRRPRGHPRRASTTCLAGRRRRLAVAVLSARRWPTSATTCPTTATSTRCSARWPTSTGCSPTAHDRGIRVMVDWVPNHTSDQHPWFLESRSSARRAASATGTSGATAADGGPPNNWLAAFGGPGLDVGRGHRPVVPAPVPPRAARPQLGATPRSSRPPCTTCCGSGSTAGSTASASTSSTSSARTRRSPTTRRAGASSTASASTTTPDPRAAARHPRGCSTPTRATG